MVSRLVALLLLGAGLGASAEAAEPTAAELWARPEPPFCVDAPKRAVSGLSTKRDFSRETPLGQVYKNSSGYTGAGRVLNAAINGHSESGRVPLPHAPATVDVEARTKALAKAATRMAIFYRDLKLRAPKLHVENGCFRVLYIKSGGDAAAFYSSGLAETVDDEDAYERWVIPMNEKKELPYYLFVTEEDGFGAQFTNGTYPTKVLHSLAHEMFHAIQYSYPRLSARGEYPERSGHQHKWVTEGLADAVAMSASEGIPFMGHPGFRLERQIASGDRTYGKLLGLRPFDYPLHLTSVPSSMKALGATGKTPTKGALEELSSYMTSSFWRFVFHDSVLPKERWRMLHQAMLTIPPRHPASRSVRHDALAWADAVIRAQHPAWTRGVYDALPPFIAHHVEAPDQDYRGTQRYSGRRGVFQHPVWLDYIFENGCPKIELNEKNPTATIVTTIKPLAATCLRVKWTGRMLPKSGSPAAAAVATLVNEARKENIHALHIGLGGKREGRSLFWTDAKTGKRTQSWNKLDFDSLNPGRTDSEAILTFINVASDPFKSTEEAYQIKIGVGYSAINGQLVKAAEPETTPPRPASKGSAAAGSRQMQPALTADGGEELDVGLGSVGEGIADAEDCMHYVLKHLAGPMGNTSIQRQREKPVQGPPDQVCNSLSQLASPGTAMAAMAKTSGKVRASLKLPRIANGFQGSIKGAELTAEWHDSARQKLTGNGDVSATTDLVNVNIVEANEAFIRGAYAARFVNASTWAGSEDQYGVNGTLTGEFLIWRADTEELITPDDPLDLLSSDWMLSASYTGLDMVRMIQQEAAAQGFGGASSGGAGGGAGGGGAGTGTGGALGETPCNCECGEMLVKSTRQRCSVQCSANYSLGGLQCALDSEKSKGSTPGEINRRLEACPRTCSDYRSADASGAIGDFCEVANFAVYSKCGSGDVTAADIERYLDLAVSGFSEPIRSEQRAAMKQQIAAMDPESRNLLVRGTLEALQ